MSLMIAALLGLVQGLTEFFPISSSAHLKLTKMLLGIPEVPIIFDLTCHLGTSIALIWFLKKEIYRLFFEEKKVLFHLLLALLPLIPCYLLLSPIRELASQPEFLGSSLMVTGAMLLLGQNLRFIKKQSPIRDVLLIGTMQSAALIPGISRSASTISCAQILGWEIKNSVRFSFLLAIPTIIGGNLLEIRKIMKQEEIMTLMNLNCVIGFIAAFIIGSFMIRFAIKWLEKGKLKQFAWYCITIGITTNLCMMIYR